MDPFLCEWVRTCTETKPTNIHGKITGFRYCIWPWHFMLLLTGQMTVMHLTAGYKGFLFCKTASTSPTYILTTAIKNIAAHRGTAKYSMAWSYKLTFPGFFCCDFFFYPLMDGAGEFKCQVSKPEEEGTPPSPLWQKIRIRNKESP